MKAQIGTMVYYYQTIHGDRPVSDFLDSLSEIQQSKILRVLQSIRTYGLSSIIPHLKKITKTSLWEIRILGKDNIRIIYLVPDKLSIILLHGFIKKTQKTSQKDLSIALDRYVDWQNRSAK